MLCAHVPRVHADRATRTIVTHLEPHLEPHLGRSGGQCVSGGARGAGPREHPPPPRASRTERVGLESEAVGVARRRFVRRRHAARRQGAGAAVAGPGSGLAPRARRVDFKRQGLLWSREEGGFGGASPCSVGRPCSPGHPSRAAPARYPAPCRRGVVPPRQARWDAGRVPRGYEKKSGSQPKGLPAQGAPSPRGSQPKGLPAQVPSSRPSSSRRLGKGSGPPRGPRLRLCVTRDEQPHNPASRVPEDPPPRPLRPHRPQ